MPNSRRFLNAFNRIEKYLQTRSKQNSWESFSSLLGRVAQTDSAVRRYRDDLREFAELRNAITHQSRGYQVIAEPSDQAVNEIEHIASLLLSPPKVIPLFQKTVFTLSLSDTVDKAVKVMYEKSYSQIPVYENEDFSGLLSTDTVARWLGACVNDDIFSLKETRVSDVLKHAEDEDNYSFLSRKATLFEALEEFQIYQGKGKKLEAILITHNGKRSEALLGVITVWDLPRLYEELERR